MFPLNENRLEPRLPGGFSGTVDTGSQPTLHLLERERMPGRKLAHFNVEDRAGTKRRRPDVLAKPHNTKDRGFVEALGFNLDRVADTLQIDKADAADANRHGRRLAHS